MTGILRVKNPGYTSVRRRKSLRLAKWLCEQKNVTKVYYVGLPEHEGHEISKAQASGFGAMISFNVKDPDMVERILERVQLIIFAESLGGVESLITYPVVQTHSAIPEEIREKIGVTDTLLRLSVGIEAVEDIIAVWNRPCLRRIPESKRNKRLGVV